MWRAALETQNAETDREIATTLKHAVIDVIEQQIKRIRAAVNGKERALTD